MTRKQINIGLEAEQHALLTAAAVKIGLDATTYARKLVLEGLSQEPGARSVGSLSQALAEMQAHIDRLDREIVSKRRSAPVVTHSTPAVGSRHAAVSGLKEWVTRPKPQPPLVVVERPQVTPAPVDREDGDD